MTPLDRNDPLAQTSLYTQQRRKRRYFSLIAAVGLLLVVLQIVLNIFWHQPINAWAMLASAGVGFVGFYGLDPKNAHDGGDFLVDSATKLIAVIRTGRRSTDATAVRVERTTVIGKPPSDDAT